MVVKEEQQRLKSLLSETIILLCKNGLNFHNEICIEGLIGITLDQEDIFLVNIKESIVPVEEVDIEQVSRVDSISTVSLSSVNNVRLKRARTVQPISFPHDADDNISVNTSGIKLNEEISAVDLPSETEAVCLRVHTVTKSIKGEENLQPVPISDTDYIDDCTASVDINVDDRNYLDSNTSRASSIPDHESSSTRSKKRRRLQQPSSEQKYTRPTSVIHDDIPATCTASVSNISGRDLDIVDNRLKLTSSQCENIKLENNSGLIEIIDDELSDGEEALKGESSHYGQYEGEYEMGGGTADEDIRGEGYVLGGGGSERVRTWQLLDPRVGGNSSSQQEVDRGCFPEEHLTTCSYCGQQFNEMSDLCSHECPLNVRNVFKRSKSVKHFPRKLVASIPGGGCSGERPFECGICKKTFTTLFNCQRHELIHTGERPFECMLCHKRFAQLANLRVHDRIHCKELSFHLSSSV